MLSVGLMLLLIPIAVLVIVWWRDEVVLKLEADPNRPALAERLLVHRTGLRSYATSLVGGLYLINDAVRRFTLRVATNSEFVRRMLAQLSRSEIAAMRRHAVLVNVGRGRLVDEEAVRERVARGEIVAALDWYPTIAGLAGLADRVPTDRPIDGIDMSAFMRGEADTSGRDFYVYMGVDAEPISSKWKNFKVHFRYTDEYSWTAPYIKRQVPMVFDLINDPHEEIDLMDAELTYAWVIGLASQPLADLAVSAAQHRHIQPGEDFQGY